MQTPYRNPVHPTYFADPCVVRVDGGYLAIGTGRTVGGRAFELLRSPDLVHWRSAGGALEPPDPALGTDLWAPEIIELDGRWWMYYSAGTGDVGHSLRVAVAADPGGPYRDCGVDLTPDEPFAIDPHPFRDTDGALYLFYARDVLEGARVGTMLAVDLVDTPTALHGTPRTVLRPSADWQIFQRQRPMYGGVHDWHTLEGPFVHRHGGRYHLFYSGGRWETADYGVATAVADHPLGPWTEPGSGRPIMATVPGRVLGPGHNTVVSTADGLDVIAYHAWDAGRTARRLCIDPIRWSDAGPRVDGPSWQATDLHRADGT